MSGKSFSVWLNKEYLPNHPDYMWMKEVSSKSVKKSIENGCSAFIRFFKGQSKFPNFKKKGKSDVKRSEEHTSELQSRFDLVCRLLLEKKKKKVKIIIVFMLLYIR